MQPELLQSERREAGAVALVADQDDSKVVSRDLGEPMRTRWIEPPLENVAVDHDGAGQVAITFPLLDGSSVDHEGSESLLSGEVHGPHPLQPLPGTGQEVVNSLSCHGLMFALLGSTDQVNFSAQSATSETSSAIALSGSLRNPRFGRSRNEKAQKRGGVVHQRLSCARSESLSLAAVRADVGDHGSRVPDRR